MQITLLFTSFSTTEPFPEIFRLTFKNVYYIIELIHRRVICSIRNNSWIRCRLKCPLSYSAFLYSNFGKYCNCYIWKHMKNYYKRNKNYMKENMSFTEGKIMQPLQTVRWQALILSFVLTGNFLFINCKILTIISGSEVFKISSHKHEWFNNLLTLILFSL